MIDCPTSSSIFYITISIHAYHHIPIFQMGNTCTALSPSSVSQREIQPQMNTVQQAVENTYDTESSNFVGKMNSILQGEDDKESSKPRAMLLPLPHASEFKYVQPKVLEEQGGAFTKSSKQVFQNLLRSQLKGKMFIHRDSLLSQQGTQTHENVQELSQSPSDLDLQEISRVLEKHFLFVQLSQQQKIQTARKMKLCNTEAGEYVFREGDTANNFFIISSGECEVDLKNQPKKIMRKGETFGEYALLFGSKRSASVKAVSRCLFFSINRLTFKRVVQEISLQTQKQSRGFLERTHFFKYLTAMQQQSVLNSVVTLQYHPHDIIINSGDFANSFYIIKSGAVRTVDHQGREITLCTGSEFGEKSFESRGARSVTPVKAETSCTLICIGKDSITDVFGASIEDVVTKNRARLALQRSTKFKSMAHDNFHPVFQSMEVRKVAAGEKLLKKGHVMKCIYVPMDVKLSTNGKDYEVGEIVEETLLLERSPLTHGIKSDKEGNVLVIKVSSKFLQEINEKALSKTVDTTNINSFKLIKKIGSGQFGQVFVALHQRSNTLVAIKRVPKVAVQKLKINKQIANEQKVMQKLNHPFVISYYHTFNTKKDILFVLEYIDGKEFYDVIREIGLLNSSQAQFYIAQILLALEYLHNIEVVYRDLKPENVMVDSVGYLKLIDMGTAKTLEKTDFFKTKTIIGTPHYMAPEIISGKGYGFSSDIWSLGVVLFELVCGYFPYEDLDNHDPLEIYNSIMKKEVSFPGYVKDQPVKAQIIRFLEKSPELRIGKGYNQLKKMEFFCGMDWELLEKRELPAPYLMMQEGRGVSLENIQNKNWQSLEDFFEKRTSVDAGVIGSWRHTNWDTHVV